MQSTVRYSILTSVCLYFQFVPLRNFLNRTDQNAELIQAALAKEVLAEIPDQVLSYMKQNNILPKPRPTATAPPPYQ